MKLVVITDVMRNHLRRVEFLTAFSRRFARQYREMQNKSKEQWKNSFQNSLIFLFGFQRITEGLCFKTKRFLKIAAKIDTISGFGQDFTQDYCMDCKKSTERGVSQAIVFLILSSRMESTAGTTKRQPIKQR